MAAPTRLSILLFCAGISVAAAPGPVAAADHAVDEARLEELIVTATRLPRKLIEIAGTVSAITDQELEQQVAVDLDDVVRYQPGISIGTNGRGGNMGFIIRGMGGNRVLTMIDGIRGSDSYLAGPVAQGNDAFEIDDLKAVEIIRGPASVLYGADAMGGAVILRTKEPADYLDGNRAYIGVRADYTSANEQTKIGFTGATRAGDWSLFGQLTNRGYEERDIAGEGNLNPLDGQSHAVLLKTVWAPAGNHKLKLALDALREDNDFVLLSDLSSSVTESLAFDETERVRVSVHHDWDLGGGFADTIATQLYDQSTDSNQHTEQLRTSFSFIDPANPATFGGTAASRVTDYGFSQDTAGFGTVLTKAFTVGRSEHALVYGFSYDQTDTARPRDRAETELATDNTTRDIVPFPFGNAETFPSKTFPDTKTERTGIFVQDEIALGRSGFTILPGIRYDRYEMDPSVDGLLDVTEFGYDVVPVSEHHTSLNLGVIYDLSEQVALFAQYAEGFRPPNYNEANQAYVQHSFMYVILPNPDLEPETSEGVEIGVKADLEHAFLSFALYDNRYEDFIDAHFVGVDNGFSLFQDRNIGKARIYGAEASASWSFAEHWQANANIAYSRGDDDEANVPLDSVEPLTGVLGVRYSGINERWSVESRVTLVGDKDRVSSADVVTASGYGLVDLIGQFRVTDNASLRVGLFNVTDREYARWANVQGLPADDPGPVALAQEPGFNVRASFRLSF